jgi:hypothetical protein
MGPEISYGSTAEKFQQYTYKFQMYHVIVRCYGIMMFTYKETSHANWKK